SLEVAAEPGRLAVTPEGREGLELLSPEPGKKRLHRFAEREAKVEKALAAALHGDLGPLAAILVDSTAAAERWRASLETTETQLGAWKSFAVLGTRSLGGEVVTQARLAFEKGRRELEVVWAGPTAEGLAIGSKLRPTWFLPAGPSRFVTFDVGTGGAVSLSCEGAGGAAPALRFETAGGAVTARRSK
ncbi:MAG TPA: hypothetical protein VIC28_19120, partial [Thermoanaerobaculia bacterium]